jgi:hypothetical protein
MQRFKIPMTNHPPTDKALMAIQGALTGVQVLDGVRLIESVVLTGGETKVIPHGLGRKLRGYLVVKSSAGAALGYLYDEQASHSDTATYLYLRAEGYSPTVSLLVF